jgi:TfoX/Sxy family transcriptional regulator of competence genes
MASDKDFVDFVAGQIEGAGVIRSRMMFGEYGVYCDEKIFALVSDNKLFIKPTSAGRKFIGKVIEAAPYPGAKLYFLIEDQIENREWLTKLVTLTLQELPPPKPKKPKRKR